MVKPGLKNPEQRGSKVHAPNHYAILLSNIYDFLWSEKCIFWFEQCSPKESYALCISEFGDFQNVIYLTKSRDQLLYFLSAKFVLTIDY